MREVSRVILRTSEAVREFRENTTVMSCMDYDLNELGIQIIETLSDQSNIETRWGVLQAWLRSHGARGDEPTPDGRILAESAGFLFDVIREQLIKSRAWDTDGKLRLSFDRWLGDDLVLTVH